MTVRIEHPQGRLPPEEWVRTGRAHAAEFTSWMNGTAKDSPKKREGRQNAQGGTCPILKHRYRSIMERRFGLYLHFLGYRRWADRNSDPPQDGQKWYGYERLTWEFPGIKGANYCYTSDYECWPALPHPDEPGRPILPYACYEVKGYMDDSSQIKLKRMAKHFPVVPIVVVDERVFDLYTHGAESIIPGWKGD